MPPDLAQESTILIAVYARCSSKMQSDTCSIDAQKRAIRDIARLRGLPEPIVYEEIETGETHDATSSH